MPDFPGIRNPWWPVPVASPETGTARTFIALTNPEADQVIDAYIFEPEVEGRSEARLPDGDGTVEPMFVPDSTTDPSRVTIRMRPPAAG